MSDLEQQLRDLVTANHILAHEQVCDALGHVSIRHPERADRFFLSCSRSPELVTRDDIMEYDLDGNPIDQRGRPMYFERPIHGAVYQARPDIMAVVHSHAYDVIPFTLTKAKLRCCIHPACALGTGVPVWDIRKKFGDTDMLVTNLAQGKDLARALGSSGQVALMRGHGSVVGTPNLRRAVLTAIYLKVNARLQSEAMRLGPVTFLSPGEIKRTAEKVNSDNSLTRMWDYWARRAGSKP